MVTPTKKHWVILLFNIIEIFHKLKIFEYHWIQKFTNNADLKKQDFLSEEKVSDRSCFVNKDLVNVQKQYEDFEAKACVLY